MLCLVGCTPNGYDRAFGDNSIQLEVQKYSKVIELTFEGETHQYIIFKDYYCTGLTHLPNCKYCKNNEDN